MNTVVRDYHQLKTFLGFRFGQFLDFMNNTFSGRARLTDHKLVGEELGEGRIARSGEWFQME